MTHDEVARTAELVREITRTHALIVVDHDMQFVRMIARTVTVMHQGAVLVEDTMDHILKNSAVRDIYLGKHGGS
jgi:branched-chain amino acid transport system ATP-binding protein/urea transport system ATP-binding protein